MAPLKWVKLEKDRESIADEFGLGTAKWRVSQICYQKDLVHQDKCEDTSYHEEKGIRILNDQF